MDTLPAALHDAMPTARPPAGRGVAWRAVLALALLGAALWAWHRLAPPLPALAALSPAIVAAVTAGLVASQLLRALRLRLDWRAHTRLPYLQCLRASLGHGVGTAVLPMRLGEFVLPWLLRRQAGLPVADAAATLLWMRLQDAMVLAWLAALTTAALAHRAGTVSAGATLAAAALASGALLLAAWTLARLAPAAGTAAPAGGGLRRHAQRLLHAARAGAGRAGWPGWLCCIGGWWLKFGASTVCLATLAGLPPLAAWAGVFGGDVASAVPVQPPAGFGFFEAGVAAAASAVAGVPAAPLLGAALVLHGWLAGVVLAGSVLVWAPVLWRPGRGSGGAGPVGASPLSDE